MSRELVSIVATVFNEEKVIEKFVERVLAAISPLESKYRFEVILVDDGSQDKSMMLMKNLMLKENRLQIIELRRNYGQASALQAGMDAANGEIIITLDSDLQHFPEEIPVFLEKIKEGYDMICGWRHTRAEGILRRWPSRVANYLIMLISGLSIHDFGTTFRCYSKYLVKEFQVFGEFHRFIPALGKDLGAKITEIPIKNIERTTGKSNYGIGRIFGVFLDIILLFFLINYIKYPIRIFGKISALCFIMGLLILSILIVTAYAYNIHTVIEYQGWFMLAILLIIISVQILLIGIIAEMLVRIQYTQGGKRTYHIRQIWSVDNNTDKTCAES